MPTSRAYGTRYAIHPNMLTHDSHGPHAVIINMDLRVHGQAPHPETPKIQKNPRTGKFIKILLLMSESLPAHKINAEIPSQYESIAVCYITFVHV